MSKNVWSFLVGTSPFCSPDKQQCYLTPGFKVGKYENSNCLIGKKIRCTWDDNTWKNTGLYNELLRQDQTQQPQKPDYQWFGNAPTCNPNVCEVIKNGYIPLSHHACGDGSCCTVNEKILGMKPQTKQQIEQNATEKELCKKYGWFNYFHYFGGSSY